MTNDSAPYPDQYQRTSVAGPKTVQPIRVIGNGRAAKAVLVEATFESGEKTQCIEKHFSAGLLTSLIYRICYQAPFAYRSNRDAILASFFRRRVVASILLATGSSTRVAKPLYVRYDEKSMSWVLAAEWIQGRGIHPGPPDASRIRRFFRGLRRIGKSQASQQVTEISEIVSTMRDLERQLIQCGLTGSGWQVAPQAIVATANLLRVGSHYTIIDLESGIPAILVPKYLKLGLAKLQLPPFDELDESRLHQWFESNHALLRRQLGEQAFDQLSADLAQLVWHTKRWKQTEIAIFRKPWHWIGSERRKQYRAECIRRWHQSKVIDEETASRMRSHSKKILGIWATGLIPVMGPSGSKFLGNQRYRRYIRAITTDRHYRSLAMRWGMSRRRINWIANGRLNSQASPSRLGFLFHQVLSLTMPRIPHRLITDSDYRWEKLRKVFELMTSRHAQTELGRQTINSTIQRWEVSQRISPSHANQLRQELSTDQIRNYLRGFGSHLALKLISPMMTPLKIAGVIAFYETRNPLLLLPLLAAPLLRTLATLTNAWIGRRERIAHREAILIGFLPFVGVAAFPIQMFATNPSISIFMLRDLASRIGCKIPIYGGANSRTEIAMIRLCDYVIEMLDCVTASTRWLGRSKTNSPVGMSATSQVNESVQVNDSAQGSTDSMVLNLEVEQATNADQSRQKNTESDVKKPLAA